MIEIGLGHYLSLGAIIFFLGVIGIFLNQKENNKFLTVRGNGEQRRDFTYVGDVVNANILASSSTY